MHTDLFRVSSIPLDSVGCAHGAQHDPFWFACAVAVISQLKSGKWRVQVRYKGRYASQSFKRKCDADIWAKQTEVDIDNGKPVTTRIRTGARTFGDLIDLHLDDLLETGKRLGRSKEHVLRRLKQDIGDTRSSN